MIEIFDGYPDVVRNQMYALRDLVIEAAGGIADVRALGETLRWGEPSYMTRSGSTVRMDWKESRPSEYAQYFHCQTTLVEIFRVYV